MLEALWYWMLGVFVCFLLAAFGGAAQAGPTVLLYVGGGFSTVWTLLVVWLEVSPDGRRHRAYEREQRRVERERGWR